MLTQPFLVYFMMQTCCFYHILALVKVFDIICMAAICVPVPLCGSDASSKPEWHRQPFLIMVGSETLPSLGAALLLPHLTCLPEKKRTALWIASSMSLFPIYYKKKWQMGSSPLLCRFLHFSFNQSAYYSYFIQTHGCGRSRTLKGGFVHAGV